ncbi:MAG: hypothetical protein Q9182_003513 [Xanthomendoza sp. 2 TL-2023]
MPSKTWDVESKFSGNDPHLNRLGNFDYIFALWDPITSQPGDWALYQLALALTHHHDPDAPWQCTGVLYRVRNRGVSGALICWVQGKGTIEADNRGRETLKVGFVIVGGTQQHREFQGVRGGGGMVVTLPGGEPGLYGCGTCVMRVENEAGVSLI